MKKNLLNKFVLSFIAAFLLVHADDVARPQGKTAFVHSLAFSGDGNIELELKVTSPRRFTVSFYNPEKAYAYVKIYDIIGNLILPPEVITAPGKFRKEYNVPGRETEFVIVEVGNGKKSITKRLFLE